MNIVYVTATERDEFETQFPRAAGFLRRKNLLGELRYFRGRKDPFTATEAYRLAELKVWACWDRGDYDCPVETAAHNAALKAMKEAAPSTE